MEKSGPMIGESRKTVILPDGIFYGNWNREKVVLNYGGAIYSFTTEKPNTGTPKSVKIIVENNLAFLYDI